MSEPEDPERADPKSVTEIKLDRRNLYREETITDLRRAAGMMREVPWIVHGPVVRDGRRAAVRELVHVELAEEHGAGVAQLAHAFGVLGRNAIGVHGARGRCQNAGCVDIVLEPDRDPVQRAAIPALPEIGLERARLSQVRLELGKETVLQGEGDLDAAGLRAQLAVRGLDLRALRSNLRRTRLEGKLDVDLGRDKQAVRGTLAEKDFSVAADVVRDGDLIAVRELLARAGGGEARAFLLGGAHDQ